MSKLLLILVLFLYFTFNSPNDAYAMHIMEGYLPLGWTLFWWGVFIPFFLWGLLKMKKITKEYPQLKLMLGLAGAFVFVLSALKIPSVTGSSSHPTGVGLGSILFGPQVMAVLGTFVLFFQAILLAHGGITTLGANAFSMAVVGPFVGYYSYKWLIRLVNKQSLAIFTAAFLANVLTYVFTSLQLALAFPTGGVGTAFIKFLAIFAVTQIPLAVVEGLLTVFVWNWLISYNAKEIHFLQDMKRGVVTGEK
ncbi:MAG TPA: energy-coupling factor ABC transporter permease [Bacillus bacterium]|nr:energy-coupling factor ABC transporter permease [Bacillus sp. (in: firmicutes)]